MQFDVLTGGGCMGAAMRTHDWANSPLGTPGNWPQSLKTLVGVLLAADQPMFIGWGADQILLYNDGYAPMLADRHPHALGRPFFDVWPEVREKLTPLFDAVDRGEAVHMADLMLELDRPRTASGGALCFRLLDEQGYTVIGAGDGMAGIKVLQSGARIDLLITDVGLPNGMNGRQVADAARALRPGLKVLFITGYAENAAVGNGCMELLTKPFTIEALSIKVADILKQPT